MNLCLSIFNATGPYAPLNNFTMPLHSGIGPDNLSYDGLTSWFGYEVIGGIAVESYVLFSCLLSAQGYFWSGRRVSQIYWNGNYFDILLSAPHQDGDDRTPVIGSYVGSYAGTPVGRYDFTIVEGTCNQTPTPNQPLVHPKCCGGIADGTPVFLDVVGGVNNGTGYAATWTAQYDAAYFTLPSGVVWIHCGVNGWFVNNGCSGSVRVSASCSPLAVVFTGGLPGGAARWTFRR